MSDPVFTTLDEMRDWFRIEQRHAAMQDYFGHPDMHRRTIDSLERVRKQHAHLFQKDRPHA